MTFIPPVKVSSETSPFYVRHPTYSWGLEVWATKPETDGELTEFGRGMKENTGHDWNKISSSYRNWKGELRTNKSTKSKLLILSEGSKYHRFVCLFSTPMVLHCSCLKCNLVPLFFYSCSITGLFWGFLSPKVQCKHCQGSHHRERMGR